MASASTTVYSPASSKYPYIVGVDWGEINTDTTNNQSTISISGYLYGQNINFSGSSQNTLNIYWYDNNTYSGGVLVASTIISKSTKGSRNSVSGTITIPHKSDGTLSGYGVAIFTKVGTNSYIPPTTTSATNWVALTTIPRGTNVPSISGFVGMSTTINLDRKSSAFTHTIRYTLGSLTNQTIATNVGTSYTWTMPTSFYAQIGATETSKTGTLYVDTYNGSTLIETKSNTFTANVNETLAKLTLTVSSILDTNSATTSLTGSSSKFIANASTCRITYSISSPSSANISSVTINGNSVATSATTYDITKIANKNITISAIDSRGFQTNYVYTISDNNWINYVPITISGDLERTDGTSGKINIKFSGNYWTGNFGSTSNTLTVQYRYQLSGGSWSSWLPSGGIATTVSGTTYHQSSTYQVSGINVNNNYIFQLRAIDKINTTGAIYEANINKAEPVVWWNNDDFTVNNVLKYTTMSQMSLEDMKKNFMELGDVLDVIKAFKIYSYNYKKEEDTEKRHYGFVIPTSKKSKFKVPEQVVTKAGDGIDPYAMCSILWRAVQELQEEIETLKNDKFDQDRKE